MCVCVCVCVCVFSFVRLVCWQESAIGGQEDAEKEADNSSEDFATFVRDVVLRLVTMLCPLGCMSM